MKIINDSRYNTDDLQALVDLFYRHEMPTEDPDLRWGVGKYYKPGMFTLHITEGYSGGAMMWRGASQSQVRQYIKPSNWRAPHRMKMLTADLIVNNPLAALSAQADDLGNLQAPEDVAIQFYMHLGVRFGTNHNLAYDVVTRHLQSAYGKGVRIRYRLGRRPKISAAGRELEGWWKISNKLWDVQYRAQGTLHNARRLSEELRRLLDFSKGRDDLTFDPEHAEKLRALLNVDVVPLLEAHNIKAC